MNSLQNNFLIAMPSLKDPFFERTVTYICEHNDEGAMGLVLNQPIDLSLASLLEQIDIETSNPELDEVPVFAGGPVGTDRGFVLHTPQEGWRSSLQLSDEVMITTSKDILSALGTDRAPSQFFLALGFAGWEAGQLEDELAANSWLTIPADADIVFNTPIKDRWEKATAQLGIDVWQLSNEAGHA
ncbi:YqgE/AlgH family protein [Aliidiomarina taiwanensis]|uniref:UPF0301 protein CWE15_07965 n=1 Tax=Aliidiomarina taiwanensis TaxID=946228 RepID=A0A432X197_9GAMM|nr:YqgE/AlgH family protein [Aliidiomarina taiwanensis]RUO40074.1 YqgE/AlgH family protein [Aliidiomarina taiwanensis]